VFSFKEPIVVIKRTYRRMNKAIRLAHSGEADSVLAAAHEILATRMKHGDALNSPATVRDYLRLLLHIRSDSYPMGRGSALQSAERKRNMLSAQCSAALNQRQTVAVGQTREKRQD
jgi:hypothetical protein